MNVGIGNDTKGFEIKKHLLKTLNAKGYEMDDVGCHSLEPVDYADYAKIVCEGVLSGKYKRGILICGTGNGMAMAANKIKGIRAALCHDIFSAVMSREHNDANILCMGGWMISPDRAVEVAGHWLDMRFAGGIHVAKKEKMMALEQ